MGRKMGKDLASVAVFLCLPGISTVLNEVNGSLRCV